MPDHTDPEPWLSYEAIGFLTKQKAQTIENKAVGLLRHPLAPFIKLSHLVAKETAERAEKEKAKTEPKTRRKRTPRRK